MAITRVLDLGCGVGETPTKLAFPHHWKITGADVRVADLARAHATYPFRHYVGANGELLPFASATFDYVVANVALPYMRIALALAEIRRVLKPAPAGLLWASLHPWAFTISELRRARKHPFALVFRASVLARGAMFHITGRNAAECFQTERGMRLALARAGFSDVRFDHDAKRWFVQAR